MKKLFLTILVSAICGTMMALNPGETAYMEINFSGAGKTATVSLLEMTGMTDNFDNLYDGRLMRTSAANSVFAYSMVYSTLVNPAANVECDVVARENLAGTLISFESNSASSYTISFFGVEGANYVLYDLVENQSVAIADASSLTFSATPNTVYANRFMIGKSYTVKTNAAGYASYSNALDLVFAAGQTGVAAYSAAYDEANSELTLTAEAGVNANTGVIIYGAPSTTYTLVPGDVADYESGLTASVTETTVDASKTNYCLTTLNGNCAFYEYTGTTVPANKAYLEVGGSAAPARIRMRINNAATGLDNVSDEAVLGEKVLVGGQLLIRKGESYYNMQGQIVK